MRKEKNTLARFLEIPKLVAETKKMYAQYGNLLEEAKMALIRKEQSRRLEHSINLNIDRLRALADPEPTDEEIVELKELADKVANIKNPTDMDRAMESLAFYFEAGIDAEKLSHNDKIEAESLRLDYLEEYRDYSGISDILDARLIPFRPTPRRY